MDKESIQIGAAYKQLEAQHFSGGYFSEPVQAEVERFQQLSDEERQAFFADTFNATYSLAVAIRTHYRFSEETGEINLSDEGLGTVGIDLAYCSSEEAELDDVSPYKGILVTTVFDPVPRKGSEWINAPGDDLGLETHGPTLVTYDGAPRAWGEHVFAGLDGKLDETDYDIDQEVLRLLDVRETLEVIRETLGMPALNESLAA